MTDGFGTVTWWGFSPALDFQDRDLFSIFKDMKVDDTSTEPLNILLVGSGDSRHLLKTMAHAYRWPQRQINFYVLEHNLELYARHLLFLTIALESQQRMGLQEKCELYIELFGNTLVRQQSAEYTEKMASEFIRMVTDSDYLEKKLPIVDLSLLKFKERDFLEGIFKFWRNKERKKMDFDVEKSWDLRLRQYLGARYDSQKGAFDWDYHMKIIDKGVKIIHKYEYNKWRSTGIGFEVREATYDTPNRTLASGMILKNQEGDKVARRGYWGDIIVGPYVAYGIECEEKSFFEEKKWSTSKDVL